MTRAVQVVGINEALGAHVRKRREDLGLRQTDVAELVANGTGLAWTRNTVTAIEMGKRAATVGELIALAFVLQTSVADLLDPRSHEAIRTEADHGPLCLDLGGGKWLPAVVAGMTLSKKPEAIGRVYQDTPTGRDGIDIERFQFDAMAAVADPTLAAVVEGMTAAGRATLVDMQEAVACFLLWRDEQQGALKKAKTTTDAVDLMLAELLAGASTAGKDPERVQRALRIRAVDSLAAQLVAYLRPARLRMADERKKSKK